tara:strand:+ start:346 stop:483 length:138 start_codon:yes stop_codon:yes gene_type:complete
LNKRKEKEINQKERNQKESKGIKRTKPTTDRNGYYSGKDGASSEV